MVFALSVCDNGHCGDDNKAGVARHYALCVALDHTMHSSFPHYSRCGIFLFAFYRWFDDIGGVDDTPRQCACVVPLRGGSAARKECENEVNRPFDIAFGLNLPCAWQLKVRKFGGAMSDESDWSDWSDGGLVLISFC